MRRPENAAPIALASVRPSPYDAVGALFAQLAGQAGDGAARAGGSHEHVDLAAALLDDLLRGAVVVRQWVVRVAVLVEDHRVGDLLLEAAGHANVALGRVC